jgi:catechol 2,3-dioxygenase-like lactoylglutathione lyase family enzyme
MSPIQWSLAAFPTAISIPSHYYHDQTLTPPSLLSVRPTETARMNRRIGQIAVVVSDQKRSTDFYASVFGMDHIFGTAEFRGQQADQIQGRENVASSAQWLIDDRELFQLEVFQFEHPESRPLAHDHSLCDEGYNRVIIAVKSLQQVSDAAVSAGGSVVALLCGEEEHPTHALLKDPDGILLELVEDPDLVPGARPAKIIGLGISSQDLPNTVEDMCEGFGFTPCEDRFQHGVFWQENGRLERLQTLRLDDMYLVVSQYQDSRSPDHHLPQRPARVLDRDDLHGQEALGAVWLRTSKPEG